MAHWKRQAHMLQNLQQKYKQYYFDKTIEASDAL